MRLKFCANVHNNSELQTLFLFSFIKFKIKNKSLLKKHNYLLFNSLETATASTIKNKNKGTTKLILST